MLPGFLYRSTAGLVAWGVALLLVATWAALYAFQSLVPLGGLGLTRVYLNPAFKVRLAVPVAWQPATEPRDPDGLPLRWVGESGWLELGTTPGDGVILTEVAASVGGFGPNPDIRTVLVAGQPAAVITPRQSGVDQAALVVTYPWPVTIGSHNARFLVLRASWPHVYALGHTLEFTANTTAEISDLPNVMVYEPVAMSQVDSVFTVTGIARVFENTVSLKVVAEDGRWLLQDFVTATAPDVGTYGTFRKQLVLPDTAVSSGSSITLEVFQSSAKDGSEIDKVNVPLQVGAVTELTRVKAYFGTSEAEPGEECTTVAPVERQVAKTQAVARAAMLELLQGPTPDERNLGYSTSLPPGVTLQRLVIENGTAVADLSRVLEQGVGGSCRVTAIRAQIEATLKQFVSVQTVIISIDGRTEDILQP